MNHEDLFLAIGRNFTGAYHTQRTIHEMADKLPPEAQEIAARVKWYSMGERFHGLADVVGGQPVVLLSDYMPVDDAHGIAAHELGHVILHETAQATVEDLVNREAQAAQLARGWGFTGSGVDVGGSVADALERSSRWGHAMPEGYSGPGVGLYADWETAWAVHKSALWSQLRETFTPGQRDLWAKIQESGSQVEICSMWARGLGQKMPKPPPPPKP